MIHHVQSVVIDDLVYLVGGLADFPALQVNSIFVYDPAADEFRRVGNMPEGRDRGAGGVAVWEGRIYYAGGRPRRPAGPLVDVYDPNTGRWTELPDMPEARDHFHAAILDGDTHAIGGRALQVGDVVETDYAIPLDDLDSGWEELPESLPTKRGGFAIAVLNDEILVIGGEDEEEGLRTHYGTVEAFDPETGRWRRLQNMSVARHGIQAVVCEGAIYVSGGATAEDVSRDTRVLEVFRGEDAGPCG